jgi:hypothetical protein
MFIFNVIGDLIIELFNTVPIFERKCSIENSKTRFPPFYFKWFLVYENFKKSLFRVVRGIFIAFF